MRLIPKRHYEVKPGVLPAYLFGGPTSLDGDSLAMVPCEDHCLWWEWLGRKWRHQAWSVPR